MPRLYQGPDPAAPPWHARAESRLDPGARHPNVSHAGGPIQSVGSMIWLPRNEKKPERSAEDTTSRGREGGEEWANNPKECTQALETSEQYSATRRPQAKAAGHVMTQKPTASRAPRPSRN
eukprot:7731116-Alexandrium_andersonii.AAC.1